MSESAGESFPRDESAAGPSPASPLAVGKEPPARGPHVARGDRVFRLKRYVIVVLLFGFGVWSAYHGFVSWPRETQRALELESQIQNVPQASDQYVRLTEERKLYTRHTDTDIWFNRVAAVVLPPLALLLLMRWLHMSRGEVRLDEMDTLHAPGHPPIPASAVRRLDDERWERKGISYVLYEGPDGQEGRFRLDHDWYEPRAIHAIHGRLAYLLKLRPGSQADTGDNDSRH